MNNRLVTLFGGAGFVGRYAAQALLRAGARVRFAERDPRRAFFLKPLGGLGQTQFVAADIGRADTVRRAVEGADAVVNLIGTFGADMERVHVDGAHTMATAARAAGVEALVHVSAIGADPAGTSRYGRTKGLGEAAVRDAFPTVTILRPSVVFGPEDDFLNRFARLIARAPAVPVLRGPARFQPVFGADVADAIRFAATQPDRYAGVTAELGGPDVVTMAELMRFIADTLHRPGRQVPLPDIAGAILSRLPFAPLDTDQWLMLQRDNVVAPDAPGLATFGVPATPMASVAPGYLVRHRRLGRFARRPAEKQDATADLSA